MMQDTFARRLALILAVIFVCLVSSTVPAAPPQTPMIVSPPPIAAPATAFSWDLAPATPEGPILADAATRPTEIGASAVTLLDEGRQVVFPDLSSETYGHFIFKALGKGVSYKSVVGDSSYDVSDVQSCRILHGNGTTEDVTHSRLKKRLSSPVLPGDVVDILLHDRSPRQSMQLFLSEWEFDCEHASVRLSHYILITPAALTYQLQPHGAAPAPATREVGGWRIAEWHASNLPAVPVEAFSPAFMDRASWVAISTTTSSRAMVKAFTQMLKPFRVPDKTVYARALAVTRNIPGEEERIHALAAFVISLKNKSHNEGSIPAKPARVLRDGYGDCKDKSMLLLAMLAAVHIPADPVLISERLNSGVCLNASLPSFDHAIVLVQTAQGPQWIDPTTNMLRHGDNLIYYDQDVPALIINDATTDYIRTPILPIAQYCTTNTSFLTLTADGQLRGTTSWRSTGEYGMALRAVAREIAPKKYHQMLQDVLSRGIEAQSKIELDDGAFTGLDYTDTPPGFTTTFHIEHYATRTEHTLQCPLPFTTPITLEDDAPRKTDAEISATYGKYITNISLELPEGFTVPNLPAASATSPWGSYRESATLQGNLLLVHWEVTQTVLRVPVNDAAHYCEFMFGMYQASQAQLTLVPVQATSTTQVSRLPERELTRLRRARFARRS